MGYARFISRDPGNEWIPRVYPAGTVEAIRKYADLPLEVLGLADLTTRAQDLRDTEYLFSTWGMPAMSGEEIERFFPALKAVFYGAGTVQGFARPFLKKGITVVSSWAANAEPVAEFTLAQILLANKGFLRNTRRATLDYQSARVAADAYPGNYGTCVGILGAGMIGTRVIELLKPFHLEIFVFDPYLTEIRAQQLGVKKVSLAEIFSQCQTISNHIANLPATRGLLDRACFDRMLPNATFINTGRGAQVVEADLVAALIASPGRTAVLDVTDPEPPAPDSDLLKLDNVFLSTHIAGSKGLEVERMGVYMAEEFSRYCEGRPLRYAVTLEMLETMA